MQPLTAPPRDDLTADQVKALLTGPRMQVSSGLELLDASLNLVEDISADMQSWTVKRSMTPDVVVHGQLDLTISRELAWGRDRVRPFMTLSNAGVSARFNLGVYMATSTPTNDAGETPRTWKVSCSDQLYLLQNYVEDSYQFDSGTVVLDAIRDLLTDAGWTAPVLLDSTAAGKTLDSPMSFLVTESDTPTFIAILNSLLAAIAYQAAWCDWDGALRSGPIVAPENRPSEWDFLVGDIRRGVVSGDRNSAAELWNAPNYRKFVRKGLTTAPADGSGSTVRENEDVGLSSQASVERVVRAPVQFVDAVDQDALEAQADAIQAAGLRATETLTAKTSPFPLAWHLDVVTWQDAVLGNRKAQSTQLQLDSKGSDMTYVLQSVSSG